MVYKHLPEMKISIYQEMMQFLKKHVFPSFYTTACGLQRLNSPKYTKSAFYWYWTGGDWNSTPTLKSTSLVEGIFETKMNLFVLPWECGGLSEKFCLIRVPSTVKTVNSIPLFDPPCLVEPPGVHLGLCTML